MTQHTHTYIHTYKWGITSNSLQFYIFFIFNDIVKINTDTNEEKLRVTSSQLAAKNVRGRIMK